MALTNAWNDLVHDMRDEMHDIATINRVDAARQAYLGLWATFIAVPLLFGLDKLVGVMTDNWEGYLAGWVNSLFPGDASDAVIWLGVIELIVAALVLTMPRIGGDVFAVWMLLAAINLFSNEMHELAVGALALGICSLCMARMSTHYHHREGVLR